MGRTQHLKKMEVGLLKRHLQHRNWGCFGGGEEEAIKARCDFISFLHYLCEVGAGIISVR